MPSLASRAWSNCASFSRGVPRAWTFERAQASTRAAMGDDAFAAAWAAGRAMSLAQAIAGANRAHGEHGDRTGHRLPQ